jgi:hypothetical protein
MKVNFARRTLGALLLSVVACVYVPRTMWNRAEENRSRIDQIRVGQTLDEVRALMRKPPEKREVRQRFDGKEIEFWSYVTDYARKLDSTITFVDGRVTEIRATTWQEPD